MFVENGKAVKLMMTQALPLCFGYLLSNAEWAVLTVMASYLGPAEVAAWAILGSIWALLYSTTGGLGDAAEIRVSYHLGTNSPMMAKLSAYKSLFLGMVVACITSIVYFLLQDVIPLWFTTDETLQGMLRELLPFVGVANLAMMFGMQCWSIIGAQGNYSLATWVNGFSSWFICIPLAAVLIFEYQIDLQALAAAVAVGYVTTGAILSFVLLSTDWYQVVHKVQQNNNDDTEKANERMFASLSPHKNGAKAAARGNVQLVTVPHGYRSGIVVGTMEDRPGNYVTHIKFWSPLRGAVHVGNPILAINGVDATGMNKEDLTKALDCGDRDRFVALVAPKIDDDDDDDGDEFYYPEESYRQRVAQYVLGLWDQWISWWRSTRRKCQDMGDEKDEAETVAEEVVDQDERGCAESNEEDSPEGADSLPWSSSTHSFR